MLGLALLALAMAVGPAWSAEAVVTDSLVACTDVTDSLERLRCFDREIAPFANARTTAAAAPALAAPAQKNLQAPPDPPSAAAALSATGATTGAASLGQEQLGVRSRPSTEAEEQFLHASITSLRQIGPGTYLVSLDNGQTWRHENESQGSFLRKGEAITIRKATLGAYRLTRDAGDAKNWIRVTRVR